MRPAQGGLTSGPACPQLDVALEPTAPGSPAWERSGTLVTQSCQGPTKSQDALCTHHGPSLPSCAQALWGGPAGCGGPGGWSWVGLSPLWPRQRDRQPLVSFSVQQEDPSAPVAPSSEPQGSAGPLPCEQSLGRLHSPQGSALDTTPAAMKEGHLGTRPRSRMKATSSSGKAHALEPGAYPPHVQRRSGC